MTCDFHPKKSWEHKGFQPLDGYIQPSALTLVGVTSHRLNGAEVLLFSDMAPLVCDRILS